MEPFTLGQRSLAILRNGLKLLGVGFSASMLGERCQGSGLRAAALGWGLGVGRRTGHDRRTGRGN